MSIARIAGRAGVVLVSVMLIVVFGSLGTIAQAPTVVLSGVYTQGQATRGGAAYEKECAYCHGPDLGGEGFAPSLVGDVFVQRWKDSVVGDLYSVIRETMPADRPGGLSDETCADIVAYVLKMNGYPAGQQALSTDPIALKQIKFRQP
jgi:mono/diheme cytochrome c family protein